MVGNKILLSIFSAIFVTACAVPNYQDTEVGPSSLKALCFSTIDQCLNLTWEVKPTDSTMGSFLIHFFQPATPNVFIDPLYNADVVLWMPDMGHGSSPVTVEKISPGIYRASRVFFIMPGQWEIRIQMKDGMDNVVDQLIQNITI